MKILSNDGNDYMTMVHSPESVWIIQLHTHYRGLVPADFDPTCLQLELHCLLLQIETDIKQS